MKHKNCPQWLRDICEDYLGDVDGLRYCLRDEPAEDREFLKNCSKCGWHKYWERSIKRSNKLLDDQLAEELNLT